MHITLKPLCGLVGWGGEMASKAANVSLHSVREGKVPAGDAAVGQDVILMFESRDKWDVSQFCGFELFGDSLLLVLEPGLEAFETLLQACNK